jgi:hypothetical protein
MILMVSGNPLPKTVIGIKNGIKFWMIQTSPFTGGSLVEKQIPVTMPLIFMFKKAVGIRMPLSMTAL